MLVLSRKPGQRISLGDEIDVTVLEIAGDRVRLGFRAPASIRIVRDDAGKQHRTNEDKDGLTGLPFPVAEAAVDVEGSRRRDCA